MPATLFGRLCQAVVTKTLSAASQDLLHFSIVMVSVYVCLAVAAVVLFGEDVEEFSTLDRCQPAVTRGALVREGLGMLVA